jgi:hypothetical protein
MTLLQDLNTEDAFTAHVLRTKLRVKSDSKRLEVKEISRQINYKLPTK